MSIQQLQQNLTVSTPASLSPEDTSTNFVSSERLAASSI